MKLLNKLVTMVLQTYMYTGNKITKYICTCRLSYFQHPNILGIYNNLTFLSFPRKPYFLPWSNVSNSNSQNFPAGDYFSNEILLYFWLKEILPVSLLSIIFSLYPNISEWRTWLWVLQAYCSKPFEPLLVNCSNATCLVTPPPPWFSPNLQNTSPLRSSDCYHILLLKPNTPSNSLSALQWVFYFK